MAINLRRPCKPLQPSTAPWIPLLTPPSSTPTLGLLRPVGSPALLGRLRGRKPNRKRNDKEWNECNVIEEEGDFDDFYGNRGFNRRCQYLIVLMGFVLLFTLFCLIIWGASRPHRFRVAVKSLTVNNFYYGVGSDWTGVPTKLLTANCSVKMIIDNPATFFGIHVSSTPLNLIYAQITVATGQLKKYYQPRKSQRIISVNLQSDNVPLYGAGASLAVADNNGGIPLKLEFEIHSQGNVVGKLVKTKHQRQISCSLIIDSGNTEAIKFREDSCTYD
ncbi:hypothetical protein F0562_029971 [Nyssa sinensis]|uniref:Uncharacterized protein n=1 Tax=Nyssa sinensis TaxID=561372 RepID=A0A5J5AXB2_9ASTE|nr:hypothetical protein F0562_029971 [Nyssa sinensis]